MRNAGYKLLGEKKSEGVIKLENVNQIIFDGIALIIRDLRPVVIDEDISDDKEEAYESGYYDALEDLIGKLNNGQPIAPTGILRHVDKMGRIVLPVDVRELMGLRCGDEIMVSAMKDGSVVMERRGISEKRNS